MTCTCTYREDGCLIRRCNHCVSAIIKRWQGKARCDSCINGKVYKWDGQELKSIKDCIDCGGAGMAPKDTRAEQ